MLKNQLKNDLLSALKEKNEKKVSILRVALSKIQNEEINKQRQLTDEEVILIIQKLRQELEEAKEAAIKAKRQDLEKKANEELNIIAPYLPKPLSDNELKQEIQKIIEENKDLWQKNQKSLIGICVKALKTKAETKRIIEVINYFQNETN
jgi:Uncharacterized conserved protein